MLECIKPFSVVYIFSFPYTKVICCLKGRFYACFFSFLLCWVHILLVLLCTIYLLLFYFKIKYPILRLFHYILIVCFHHVRKRRKHLSKIVNFQITNHNGCDSFNHRANM